MHWLRARDEGQSPQSQGTAGQGDVSWKGQAELGREAAACWTCTQYLYRAGWHAGLCDRGRQVHSKCWVGISSV